ncbi:MAG TPA: thiamine-phosphate kinase [Thermoanaerobaculia bacterium]|nr:thiamine-phosphate kinase [Thermoanaerobaculia bacterium]
MSESERALLAWLRQEARSAGGELLGDDCACLPAAGPLAVTVDTQIEGTHFLPGTDEALLGPRLLAVNLSDLAAQGALPQWAVLTVAAPAGFRHRRFFRTLVGACRRWGVKLAGGDLARAPLVALTLTLIGVKRPGGRWLERRLARPGDGLFVGGTLGESAAGQRLLARGARLSGRSVVLPADLPERGTLAAAARRAVSRHLRPTPQLELSAWLAEQERVGAIDVSDGLALDLDRLCGEGAVGARIEAESLPFSPRLAELAAWLGEDARRLALTGGEDYVLLFTLPALQAPPPRFGAVRIGSITRARKVEIVEGGQRNELPAAGWDHLDRHSQ